MLSKAFLRLRISPSHCRCMSPGLALLQPETLCSWLGAGECHPGQSDGGAGLSGRLDSSQQLPPTPSREAACISTAAAVQTSLPGLLATQPRCILGRRQPRPKPYGTEWRSSRNLCGGTSLSLGALKPGRHLGWPVPSEVSHERPESGGDKPASSHYALQPWGVSPHGCSPLAFRGEGTLRCPPENSDPLTHQGSLPQVLSPTHRA